MSFIGKVLIVIQIVLSIMFAALATTVYSYHQSWKVVAEKRADDLKKTKQEMDTQVSFLNSRLDAETKRATDAESAQAAVQAQLRDVTTERNNLQVNYDRVTGDYQRATALVAINADEAGFRRDEALAQRAENKQLHIKLDDSNEALINARTDLFNLQAEQVALEDKYNGLLNETAYLKRVVRLNDLETDPAAYQAKLDPPPKVEGLVLETQKHKNGTVQFVKISLGSDDGLVEGHELDVYRTGYDTTQNSKYLGKIKITYLTPDTAVGTILTPVKSGVIEKGDNVTSKLR
jgi:predicted nuclease with TOPRIM domain